MYHSAASFRRTAASHSLLHAAKWLVSDLLSTLTFAALYAATHSVIVGVAGGIAIGVGQIVYLRHRRTPIDTMQWISLFLVIVFGGAAVLTRNPAFIMMKPTLIYLAVGVVMLPPAG
jgi:intracellular septation protein